MTLGISAILQRWENGTSGARTARYGCAETNTEEKRGVVRASCSPLTLALVSAEGLFLGQDCLMSTRSVLLGGTGMKVSDALWIIF